MSRRIGDHDEWAFSGWGDTTGHAPGAQQGRADAPTWGDQQQWDSPVAGTGAPPPAGSAGWPPSGSSSGSSGGRTAGLVVAGVATAVVIIGLLAAVAFLLLDWGPGVETTAGGSTPPAEAGSSSDQGSGADSQGSAGTAGGAAAPTSGASGGTELAPASGTYSGMLSQRGTRRSDSDYAVEMTFSSQGSTVNYPALGCRGTLTPTGDSDGARVYRENITSGRCDPMGTWYVTKGSDHAVSAEYQPSGADYVVVGQLTK